MSPKLDVGMDLGRIGLFLGQFGWLRIPQQRQCLAEIEGYGFHTIWYGETFGRESLTQGAILLSSTRSAIIASGIANVYARDAVAMSNGARTLAEGWPNRFLLGLGVSHRQFVERRGGLYDSPIRKMELYLDSMESAPWRGPTGESPPRVLAALGPKMLQLARRTAGACPFFVPVEHTRHARAVLGSDALLAPEQAVIFAPDLTSARSIGDGYMRTYLSIGVYRRNLQRLGWTEEDIAGCGSDRLFNALVAWGDAEAMSKRVQEHMMAGADHVALNIVTADPQRPYIAEVRSLASLLVD